MDNRKNLAIRILPRFFTVALILFLAVFSLDVFDGHSGPWDIALGLVIHNIPSILLLIILSIAWNREWMGAMAFPLFAVAFFLSNPAAHWSVHLLITLPLLVIGVLYYLAWRSHAKITPAVQS